MVDKITVVRENAAFSSQNHQGRVCVFAGATMGIGYSTLRRMVTMLHSSTFYVLGRSPSRFSEKLTELKALAPTNDIIFIEVDLSLIADIDSACKRLTSVAKKVDYLCMSAGGFPFQGAVYTSEHLELSFVVSYYSRLRMVTNLLPLLRKSTNPRVLSVLNGTNEQRIDEDDVGLDKKWNPLRLVSHATTCMSLGFEYLAADIQNESIAFIHAHPGFVNTGTPRTKHPSTKDGIVWWAFLSVMQVITGWIMRLFGFSLQESGERNAFYLTNARYVPGSLQTNKMNDSLLANKALQYYQENKWPQRVWDHTSMVWEKALSLELQ
ncbi:hypothetical protein F5Y15DRAFT_378026 [Xylariaceae sp. FL0016]|nr:hypothetical protein F5Y15DRAFT_378026 [Xylariaceae sp. FL0016]